MKKLTRKRVKRVGRVYKVIHRDELINIGIDISTFKKHDLYVRCDEIEGRYYWCTLISGDREYRGYYITSYYFGDEEVNA